MKTYLHIILSTVMSIMLLSSCANKKGEKFLNEIEKPADEVVDQQMQDEVEDSNSDAQTLEVTFSNFLSNFPEKEFPFNLKDISFTSYIETEFVLKHIDSEYLVKDSLELVQADDEESYTPLKYAYAAKIELEDMYLLAYYQIRENVGPRGNYTLAAYSMKGELLDSINFDIFNVYLDGSDEVVVYTDSIVTSIDGIKRSLFMSELGEFEK